jgi:hypothetical protein
MKRLRLASFIFCLAMAFTLSTLHSFGQTPEDDLTSKPIEVHLKNATLIYVLSKISMEHRVPMGLEYSTTDKKEPKLNIDVKNGTLRDVLDSIVEQEPIYRWEVRDGVINFTPIQARERFFEKLLDTRISQFVPKKGISKFELRNTLVDLPEVKTFLEAENITVIKLGDYVYHPSIYSNDEVDLSIFNTDVRGVLNNIVRESEHKLWVLGWRTENKDSIAIGF